MLYQYNRGISPQFSDLRSASSHSCFAFIFLLPNIFFHFVFIVVCVFYLRMGISFCVLLFNGRVGENISSVSFVRVSYLFILYILNFILFMYCISPTLLLVSGTHILSKVLVWSAVCLLSIQVFYLDLVFPSIIWVASVICLNAASVLCIDKILPWILFIVSLCILAQRTCIVLTIFPFLKFIPMSIYSFSNAPCSLPYASCFCTVPLYIS